MGRQDMYRQYFQPLIHFCNHGEDEPLAGLLGNLFWRTHSLTQSVVLKDTSAGQSPTQYSHLQPCYALSPPVFVPVPWARAAPATGPPTPATGHPAAGGWRRRRGRRGWPATRFFLPPAPTVIFTVRRAPTHAGWLSAGTTPTHTHTHRSNLLMS